MALVDGNAKFRYIDVGAYGRNSDGGIFRNSSIGKALEQNQPGIPTDSSLPFNQAGELFPYVFLTDEAFPLQRHIMGPYPGTNLTMDKQAFNYRLSRRRSIVENAFRVLSQRFRIFHTKINVSVETVKEIIKACCLLHNIIRDEPCAVPIDAYCLGNERRFTTMDGDTELESEAAQKVRDRLKDLLVAYPLSWQNKYLNRGIQD